MGRFLPVPKIPLVVQTLHTLRADVSEILLHSGIEDVMNLVFPPSSLPFNLFTRLISDVSRQGGLRVQRAAAVSEPSSAGGWPVQRGPGSPQQLRETDLRQTGRGRDERLADSLPLDLH